MKATVESINEVQSRIKVEVTSDTVDQAFDNAYRKLQKKARIQGFRPGKAPLGMIRKMYGGGVAAEIAEKLINDHLFSAMQENSIRPIASPVIEDSATPTPGTDFGFSAVVDLMPQLNFDDYKDLEVEITTRSVADQDVERELQALQKQHGSKSSVPNDKGAEDGHVVTLSQRASLDGQPLDKMTFEEGLVTLGEGQLLPGLEEAIAGMKAGESKVATVNVPDDYEDDDLAGKSLELALTVHGIEHIDLPALDDDLAKDLGFDSLELLQADIRKQLEDRCKDANKQQLENKILDLILGKHPFKVPPAMVDQVIDSMIGELPIQDEKAKHQALTDQRYRDHFKEEAKRRTQNTLILWHVSQKEKLEVKEEDINKRLDEIISGADGGDPKQLASMRQSLEPRLRENMVFEKSMEFLIDHANVKEKEASEPSD